MPLELIVVLIVLGVLVLAGAVVVVVRRSRALPPAPSPRELAEPAKLRPVVDALIEGPIEPSPAREGAVPLPMDKPRGERPAPLSAAEQAERRRYELGLARTRGGFVARLAQLFRGKPRVSTHLKDEVEEVLFTADIGAKTAQKLLDQVTALLDRSQIADPEQIWAVIRREAREILTRPVAPIPSLTPAPARRSTRSFRSSMLALVTTQLTVRSGTRPWSSSRSGPVGSAAGSTRPPTEPIPPPSSSRASSAATARATT